MMKYFSMSSFVGGFMLGAVLVGMWAFGDTLALPSALSSSLVQKTTTTAPTESGAISIANQPAGSVVAVDSVTVPPPGVWVAVREVNGNDLGNVLGAVRVNGPHSNILVPLLRATGPGLSYAAELYRDDGSESFDLANDSVYVDFSTGAPVIAYFMTTN